MVTRRHLELRRQRCGSALPPENLLLLSRGSISSSKFKERHACQVETPSPLKGAEGLPAGHVLDSGALAVEGDRAPSVADFPHRPKGSGNIADLELGFDGMSLSGHEAEGHDAAILNALPVGS